MVVIPSFSSTNLTINDLNIKKGEWWCFVGANNSGINAFLEVLAGGVEIDDGITIPKSLTVLSFASQQEIYEEELKKDDTDFLNYLDPGTAARSFLSDLENHKELIAKFKFEDLLDQGFKQLSTGQTRKLLLLEAFTSGIECIVVESPYDGLDIVAKEELDEAFRFCIQNDRTIIVSINNHQDLTEAATHIGIFSNDELLHMGSRNDIISKVDLSTFFESKILDLESVASHLSIEDHDETSSDSLICLTEGYAGYDGKRIFEGLSLDVRIGGHTLITGSNGSGKSTLLQIITGDNQKCYVNELKLFGNKRGSGESIWDIKKNMGIVSPDLHRSYRVSLKAVYVVVSGLYDSIGLYKDCTRADSAKAQFWLKQIGLEAKANTPFSLLTFAEQRLVLIARALIKVPQLLILDEPTQGLDEGSRENLLNFMEFLADNNHCTIVYVSHRQDEYRDFFSQHIHLDDYSI